MEPGPFIQLDPILQHMSVGIVLLDCADFRVRYANPYLVSLLGSQWRAEDVVDRPVEEIIPDELREIALPILREVCATGQSMSWNDVAYEGFLAARGRTSWRVSIELITSAEAQRYLAGQPEWEIEDMLLVTVEDVTELARSRLYVDAIQSISSAIAGPFALPLVLDRILQAVQEMVGSTRCAIILIERSVSGVDFAVWEPGLAAPPIIREQPIIGRPPTATIAAQKGVQRSQDWHPRLSEQLLLAWAMREQQTIMITDTNKWPELDLPLLDDAGTPRRPGSVLCIPIFDPMNEGEHSVSSFTRDERNGTEARKGRVIGTIEVYHRRARGFPAEEIDLLEQFAQQAGLAIQNARLFLRINQLARDASRNLRQREHIMQAIPDGVIIYDSRWRIADANQTIRLLFGWSEDVLGLHVSEAMARSTASLPPDFQTAPPALADSDHPASERVIDEFKLIGADGNHYSIRRSFAPIQDNLGDIFAYVAIYHDVTEAAAARERIEAEVVQRTAQLEQRNVALALAKAAQELTNARMKLLLERLPSGVILVSAEDQRIELINRQATSLLQSIGLALDPGDNPDQAALGAIGRSAEELFRTPIIYTSSGSVVPYNEQPLARALYQGEASEAELHIQQAEGQMLYLLVSAAPLVAQDGGIANVVLVLHDLSQIKLLERAREDFFTTMAHELKTPLANIRAHLSALQAEDLQWSSADQRNFLENADDQVERLVGMINHFLDASRVEAGALRLELEPVLLPELIEDLQERLEALIAASKRRLEISISDAVPAVIADYELLMSVLINLLSNAFRYAPEGDAVRLDVELICDEDTPEASKVEIRVTDRGPGISSEQQKALFTRFSAFAAMSRPDVDRPGQPTEERRLRSGRWSPATGLGLYISRGIVEAHGSQLTVKSSPGEGASFAFTLAVAYTNTPKEGGA
ncbi:MAG TPA: PAS domain-containing protein [Ktedonobacteraceae bacterium]|nr:PAS domain-containing protein [Ktedonobacteraceae bacterium]